MLEAIYAYVVNSPFCGGVAVSPHPYAAVRLRIESRSFSRRSRCARPAPNLRTKKSKKERICHYLWSYLNFPATNIFVFQLDLLVCATGTCW